MIQARKNETELVRLERSHVHRRTLCGPGTDNETIYLRPGQARRLKAAGVAKPESKPDAKGGGARGGGTSAGEDSA